MAAPWMPRQLPSCVRYGMEVMPGWRVDISTQSDGHESPNITWAESRHEYVLAFSTKNPVEYHAAKSHFNEARGMLKTWPLIDPLDHTVSLTEGVFSETPSGIQARKRYGEDGDVYDRKITRPFSALVYENDVLAVGVTIDPDTGLLVGADSGSDPADFTWEGQFYVPVRYNIERFPGTVSNRTGQGFFVECSGIEVVERKE